MVLSPDGAGPPQYRVPYAVAGCLSIVNGLVALGILAHDVRTFVSAVRGSHAAEPALPTEEAAEETGGAASAAVSLPALIKQLEWELAALTRELKRATMSLVSILFENVPMVRGRAGLCGLGRGKTPRAGVVDGFAWLDCVCVCVCLVGGAGRAARRQGAVQ